MNLTKGRDISDAAAVAMLQGRLARLDTVLNLAAMASEKPGGSGALITQ
jgi:hypothetical protein